VFPPAPMADQIRRATFRAIYGDSAMTKYGFQAVPSIHIIVKGGHVTLEGVGDTDADKNLANVRANSAPNVFRVQNHMRVQRRARNVESLNALPELIETTRPILGDFRDRPLSINVAGSSAFVECLLIEGDVLSDHLLD
jgi:hypothetical protein